jgi:hypothetical protein
LSAQTGLKVVSVRGFAKDSGYVEGASFNETNHAWNAIWLENRWWLIDATWGAGYLSEKGFVKEFNEFFFLAPPDKLIWTHLPEDAKWQLLDMPITLSQFEQRPRATFQLWDLGITPEAIRAQVVKDRDKGLVKAGKTPAKVTLLEAPLQGRLESGTSYIFKFKSADFEYMVAWAKDQVDYQFTKSGDVFQLNVQVQKGELNVAGCLLNEKRARTILRYVVE